ncbi:hypothetical protein COCNU_scaffold002416G000020 [Cocos nucifera]|nr:hypothetical protein [Cocos nucifera]
MGSSDDGTDGEHSPFDDWKVIKTLIDGCKLPDIIDQIVLTDLKQWTKDSLGAFLKAKVSKAMEVAQECQAEVGCLLVEVEHPQEALKKEELVSPDLRATLTLKEEKRKEAEINFAEEKRQVAKAMEDAVSSFKSSEEQKKIKMDHPEGLQQEIRALPSKGHREVSRTEPQLLSERIL